LRSAWRPAKAAPTCFEGTRPMVALGVIALFIIGFAALNLYEFGRVD
jgi:hypothetical protein